MTWFALVAQPDQVRRLSETALRSQDRGQRSLGLRRVGSKCGFVDPDRLWDHDGCFQNRCNELASSATSRGCSTAAANGLQHQPNGSAEKTKEKELAEQLRLRQAEAARRQEEAANKRKEEQAAALTPQWRPFQNGSGRQSWTVVQSGAMKASERDLVRWKGTESGFRITSLTMPRSFSAAARQQVYLVSGWATTIHRRQRQLRL